MALRMGLFAGFTRCLFAAAAILAAGTLRSAASERVVHVEPDEKANAAHVRASIDISAPPLTVWAVITDCARQPQIVPNLESCRIVKHNPGGHWDIREHVINWAALLPKLRTVVRTSYEIGHRMLFKRVDGDMRVSQGEWRVEPLGNGQATRLYYNALVAPNFPVPEFLIERASVADAAKH